MPDAGQAFRTPVTGVTVDATYVIAGVLALLLLAYLVATLLKPEWFG